MMRIVLYVCCILLHISTTFAKFVTDVSFKSRENRVFEFYPPSIWEGEVKSYQIGTGSKLSICVDDLWSDAIADEICKDIGFPDGAMLHGTLPVANDETDTVSCTYVENDGFFCRKRNKKCRLTAWVSCQFPGLFGCFPFNRGELPWNTFVSKNSSKNGLTVEWCVEQCRQRARDDQAPMEMMTYQFAGLVDGDKCYCGDDKPYPYRQKVDKNECKIPCPGNLRETCGGTGHIALYETKLGSCGRDLYILQNGRGFLTSPNFPGTYRRQGNSAKECLWSFQTRFFNKAVFDVIGATTTEREHLKISPYEINSAKIPSDLTWRTQNINEVLRGTTTITINNTVFAGILASFEVDPSSSGEKQFLISFELNDVPVPYTDPPPSDSLKTPSSTDKSSNTVSCISLNTLVLPAICMIWIML